MTTGSTERIAETWEQVARDLQTGWSVKLYDASTGEATGTVQNAAELTAKALRVFVCWRSDESTVCDFLEAPMAQRAIRYVDDAVLISGVGSVLLFQPKP